MTISTENMPAEYVKGRGIIRIDRRAFAEIFKDLDIKRTDTQGLLHDNGVLATLHSRLLLPESYSVLGIYLEVLRGTWAVVVESADIEAGEPDCELPILEPVYRYEMGTASLVGIHVRPW